MQILKEPLELIAKLHIALNILGVGQITLLPGNVELIVKGKAVLKLTDKKGNIMPESDELSKEIAQFHRSKRRINEILRIVHE